MNSDSRDVLEGAPPLGSDADLSEAGLLPLVWQHMPAALCLISGKDLRLKMVNPAYQAIAPGKQMLGRTLDEIWPETRQNFSAICRRVLENGATHQVTDELNTIRRTKDGPLESVYFTWSLRRVRLPGEEEWGLLNVGWETTDRKAAEDHLRGLHETFRHLVDCSPFGVYAVDADFRVFQASAGTRNAFKNVDPLIGRDFAEVLRIIWPEPFANDAIARFRHTLETGEPYHCQSMVEQRRDIAAEEAYEWKIERVVLPDGRFGVVCHYYDFSERQRYQQALRESERKHRIVADHTYDWEYWRGTDGRYLYVSPSCERICGYAPAAFMENPKLLLEMVHADDLGRFEEYAKAALTAPMELEFRIVGRDGAIRWVAKVCHPVRENGEFLGVRGSIRDVTERKKIEGDLETAKEQLRQHAANLEKTVASRTAELRAIAEQLETYVYTVAHHLRAPLRALSGYSELLLEDHSAALSEEGKGLLSRIRASSGFMDQMLLDLLAYDQVTCEEVVMEPVAVGRVFDIALAQCEIAIHQTHAEVEKVDSIAFVQAHESTLGRVVGNLISNSLKFVAPGVRPRIRLWAEQSDHVVRIFVRDNGIGVPKEQHQRIFRPFERLNGMKFPGSGIGLSIVLKAVERMGGRVGVESASGGGSCFWVELQKGRKS